MRARCVLETLAACVLLVAAFAAEAQVPYLVKDLNPQSIGSDPRSFVELGGFAYFAATSGFADRELWRSDGTVAGTTRVADLCPGACGSSPDDLAVVGGRILFTTVAPVSQLWASDGTAAGTAPVLSGCPTGCPVSARKLTSALGKVFFFASSESQVALWSSDGTAPGTGLVKRVCTGSCDNSCRN